ncbi:AmpG family muropeptide MFS transporter [Gayadomonas joobiniege]|uniref:AmpG family muropeptide MFS transporter n=1 Tax=Gayadomonas joobiniege TaxID=1234606 RepID=UPI00058C4D45|nr:MFS transporter [Gayadomonas joobiniege]
MEKILSTYTDARVIRLFFLGFSSGLPLLLVFSTLSFWLREAGIDRSSIGMLSWVALAYAVKWLWSPLVDKYKIPFTASFGRRRSWMLFSQLSISAALFIISLANPAESLTLFVIAALYIAVSSATQDIVIDAYRIDSAPTHLQAAMAATYMAGYRIAMLTSGAGSIVLAAWLAPDEGFSNLAWQQTYFIMSVCMLPGILTTLFSPEPSGCMPTEQKNKPLLAFINAFKQPVLDFFNRYGRTAILLLAVISLYRMADVVMGVMANPFYIDMGYNKVEIASVSKVYGVLMTIVGAFLGGFLLAKTSLYLALFSGALLAALTNVLFALLANLEAEIIYLTLVISLDNLSAGIATAAFIAFLSALTNKAFSATQYAIFSSCMLLLPKFAAGFSGFVVDSYNYVVFFSLTAILGIPALVLIVILGKTNFFKRLEVQQ